MEGPGSPPLPPAGGRGGLRRVLPGAVAALIVLGSLAFLLIPSQSVLVVHSVAPAGTLFCAAMAPDEEWMISFTHSVNRRPVHDFLRLEGEGLRILRSRFDAFGAGMPDVSTPENPLRLGPDGRLEYTVNRWVPDLTIRVGRVAGHALHVRGRTIPFTSLARPGTALRFAAERRSRVQLWKGRCAR